MGRAVTNVVLRDKPWKHNRAEYATYQQWENDPVVGWRAPYHAAEQKVRDANSDGRRWLTVKLPFPFMDDQAVAYWAVLELASTFGFERRPGGPSGLAYDMVFLERTS